LAKIEAMSFYIRVSSLITPLYCITQTEEPVISYNFNTIWTDENLMILLNPLSIGYISGQALIHSCTHALMQKEK